MSWKLFGQIVLLIVIAVFLMSGIKCLKKNLCAKGSLSKKACQISGAKGSRQK